MKDFNWVDRRDLKPCPFDGSKNTFSYSTELKRVYQNGRPMIETYIICHVCGARVACMNPDLELSIEGALKKWDMRA